MIKPLALVLLGSTLALPNVVDGQDRAQRKLDTQKLDTHWLRLVQSEQVWEWIDLSDEQQKEVTDFVQKTLKDVRVSNGEERLKALLSDEDCLPEEVKEILLPFQRQRLKELEIQTRLLESHPFSLGLLRRDVRSVLQLRRDQTSAIEQDTLELKTKSVELQLEHESAVREIEMGLKLRLFSLLTEEQRARYYQILGDIE